MLSSHFAVTINRHQTAGLRGRPHQHITGFLRPAGVLLGKFIPDLVTLLYGMAQNCYEVATVELIGELR